MTDIRLWLWLAGGGLISEWISTLGGFAHGFGLLVAGVGLILAATNYRHEDKSTGENPPQKPPETQA